MLNANLENVTDLTTCRIGLESKRKLNAYKDYLTYLEDSQLQSEVDYVLSDVQLSQDSPMQFKKGELILRELATRSTTGPIQNDMLKMHDQISIQNQLIQSAQYI
jgi:hypothetical protein